MTTPDRAKAPARLSHADAGRSSGNEVSFDAFWLPAIDSPATTIRSYGDGPTQVEVRFPLLTADGLTGQIDALLRAREGSLRRRPVSEVVAVIGRVAARFQDRSDTLRTTAEQFLPGVTGMSREMTELVLDRMALDWRPEQIERLLAAEFGDAAVLDDFVDRRGLRQRVHAAGPRFAVHFFSGNVPGISVTSLIRTLLVKAASLGKTASGEPILAPLFARGIAEDDPALGECLAVTYWEGGDTALESPILARADLVVAYGSSGAIDSVRARTPAGTPVHAYGNRVSFAVIARESLDEDGPDDLAAAAAAAVATFDQQGCVSPHLVFVENGGTIAANVWARSLADELERLERSLPRGSISGAESAMIQQLRGEAEIGQIAGSGQEIHASASGTEWTVVYDPSPGFRPSCLNRTVRVVPVDSLEEVLARVGVLGERLQTAGVAGPEDRLRPFATELAQLGVSRITPIARMAWPPMWWHHDGRPPLGDLVRWCDWE